MNDEIADSLKRIPLLPHSVRMLFQVINDPVANPEELAAVVNQDPTLAMQALHLCNSAYYSLPVEVTSVLHAVRLLGVDTVAGLAMAAYFQSLMDQPRISGNPWLKGTRRHFLETAQISEYLSREIPSKESPSIAFTAGLMHDIGKLPLSMLSSGLARKVTEQMEKQDIPLVEAEQEVLGCDHAEVGSMLAQHWKIPEIIEDSIRFHHIPFAGGHHLSLLIYLSNTVVHSMINKEEEYRISQPAKMPDVLEEIGLSDKELLDLTDMWIAINKESVSCEL